MQDLYSLARRKDEAFVDELAAHDVADVPYFPLGGFSPLQSDAGPAEALARLDGIEAA